MSAIPIAETLQGRLRRSHGRAGAAGALLPAPTRRCAPSTRRCCGSAASASPSSPPRCPRWTRCFEELPNFAEVLEDIRKQLALCIDTNDSVELPPMLLLGEPGIGKTHFARRLAQLLGTGFGFVPMSSLTAGWVLSGASSQWKNAKPGKVFDTFLNGDYANPVIVVDEIDKASGDGQYDPLGALYELLEAETATRFVDEFAEVPIDASGAVWLATANDPARIPEPLLSRLSVYEIEAPDAEGARAHRRIHLRRDRGAHDWGRPFPEALSAPRSSASPRCRRARCGARCRRPSAAPSSPGAPKSARTTSRTAARGKRGSASRNRGQLTDFRGNFEGRPPFWKSVAVPDFL